MTELVARLNQIPGVSWLKPGGSFYAIPRVTDICNDNSITSHGLAMFLLEAADESKGVACLGGECFGDAGSGFLRMSCSETRERIIDAVDFIHANLSAPDKIAAYLDERPHYRLQHSYVV